MLWLGEWDWEVTSEIDPPVLIQVPPEARLVLAVSPS
jgi:hypothetical protein